MASTPHTSHFSSLFCPVFLSLLAAGGSENIPPSNCERSLVTNFRLNVSVLSPGSVLLTWNNTDQYPTLEAVFSLDGERWSLNYFTAPYFGWQIFAGGTQSFTSQVTITKFSSKVSLRTPVIKYIWGTERIHLMWNQKLFISTPQVSHQKISFALIVDVSVFPGTTRTTDVIILVFLLLLWCLALSLFFKRWGQTFLSYHVRRLRWYFQGRSVTWSPTSPITSRATSLKYLNK